MNQSPSTQYPKPNTLHPLTKTIIFFTFFLLPFSFLFADTIIDSVYSDPLLDGEICFSQNLQGYIINNWMYDMFVGDSGINIIDPDPNSYIRSFISFYLPQFPQNYYIDSVFVRLYQYDSCGYDASTGTYTDFPVWNVAGGDTIKCIMSHIDYGDELDIGDWEKGDVGNPYTYQNNIGTITESGIDGYRYLDVTASVIQDYELNRDKTQYRIAFQIDTDWDYESDLVAFYTSNGYPPHDELKPTLYLTFSDEINSIGNEEIQIEQTLNIEIYPNPSIISQGRQTAISYEISQNTNVLLQIFNIKGQLVETIVNKKINAGKYTAFWNVSNHSSGIYFYRIKSGTQTATGKCLLLK
ncbi:MAG: T9SS type A sorting domain-containing protein [Candidatus Cloacimonetes bacterium]|nr:T9SS type A sorting domain-containing protein [Candidatus Cloacimonadota bacterium]